MEQDLAGSQFAPEASANSAMSYDEFAKQFFDSRGIEYGTGYKHNQNASHWIADLDNFFTGNKSAALSAYDAYLTNNQRQYEQQNINDARRFQEYLESTKYQRMAKDLKAAGLNPWLALQNGVGSTSVQPGSTSYNTSAKKFDGNKDNASKAFASILNTALRVAAILAMAG